MSQEITCPNMSCGFLNSMGEQHCVSCGENLISAEPEIPGGYVESLPEAAETFKSVVSTTMMLFFPLALIQALLGTALLVLGSSLGWVFIGLSAVICAYPFLTKDPVGKLLEARKQAKQNKE